MKIIIYPFVYIAKDTNNIMFYNTMTHKNITINNTSSNNLFDNKSKYIIPITDYILKYHSDFYNAILNGNYGEVIDSKQNPFVPEPKLKILNELNITHKKEKKEVQVERYQKIVLEYLEEIIFDVGYKYNKTLIINTIRQLYPLHIQKYVIVNIRDIITLLDILQLLRNINGIIELQINLDLISDLIRNKKFIKYLNKNIILNIIITKSNRNIFNEDFIRNISRKYFTVQVEDDGDLNFYLELLKNYTEFVLKFQLVHNNSNNDFVRNLLKFKKEDLLLKEYSMGDILSASYLNKNSFGKLYIKIDGQVCDYLNITHIGSLKNESLSEIIINELFFGNSWLFTRKQVTPCKGCLFQAFCPPISSYESRLKVYDFCNIH